jgi:hypothetical protein
VEIEVACNFIYTMQQKIQEEIFKKLTRLKTLPSGVVSKKDIGARKTL